MESSVHSDKSDSMEDYAARLRALEEQYYKLGADHQRFVAEMVAMKKEMDLLKAQLGAPKTQAPATPQTPVSRVSPESTVATPPGVERQQVPPPPRSKPASRSDWEKFIGENLIAKIGIGITVLGIAFGASYAIDHNLITPLGRILLGYLLGAVLMVLGLRLKAKYADYSAVLVSGGVAVMYFLTYFAYDYYGLIAQELAFGMMVVFTGGAVGLAVWYDRRVIAHIGQVGAYAVPFLLSDGSGRALVLFSYIALINFGIFLVSLWRAWPSLHYVALGLTATIFLVWSQSAHMSPTNLTVGVVFATIFFLEFYGMDLGQKLVRKTPAKLEEVGLLLLNSAGWFGMTYGMMGRNSDWAEGQGALAFGYAGLHALMGLILWVRQADRNLVFLATGLSASFLALAFPIQMDEHWVPLFWTGEFLALYLVGKRGGVRFYELLSLPMLGFATGSLVKWMMEAYSFSFGSFVYGGQKFGGWEMGLGLIFVGAIGLSLMVPRPNGPRPDEEFVLLQDPIQRGTFWALGLGVLYLTCLLALDTFWQGVYARSQVSVTDPNGYPTLFWNEDLLLYRQLCNLLYSMLFITLLSGVNSRLNNNRIPAQIFHWLGWAHAFLFLGLGLPWLHDLQHAYQYGHASDPIPHSPLNLGFRYVMMAGLALLIATGWANMRRMEPSFQKNMQIPVILLLHLVVLAILSSELLTWSDQVNLHQPEKLGMTILWGAYALMMIGVGIWRGKSYLRVAGIAWFGVTLAKLFLVDIREMETLPKTLVFVSLGAFLLVVAYLYNRNKNRLLPPKDEPE